MRRSSVQSYKLGAIQSDKPTRQKSVPLPLCAPILLLHVAAALSACPSATLLIVRDVT